MSFVFVLFYRRKQNRIRIWNKPWFSIMVLLTVELFFSYFRREWDKTVLMAGQILTDRWRTLHTNVLQSADRRRHRGDLRGTTLTCRDTFESLKHFLLKQRLLSSRVFYKSVFRLQLPGVIKTEEVPGGKDQIHEELRLQVWWVKTCELYLQQFSTFGTKICTRPCIKTKDLNLLCHVKSPSSLITISWAHLTLISPIQFVFSNMFTDTRCKPNNEERCFFSLTHHMTREVTNFFKECKRKQPRKTKDPLRQSM